MKMHLFYQQGISLTQLHSASSTQYTPTITLPCMYMSVQSHQKLSHICHGKSHIQLPRKKHLSEFEKFKILIFKEVVAIFLRQVQIFLRTMSTEYKYIWQNYTQRLIRKQSNLTRLCKRKGVSWVCECLSLWPN